ncbi:putative addiction module antidote protein [Tistrella mobilis]
MAETLTTYDPAAALVDDEEIAAFMADAVETGDAAYVAKALGVVARARGMTEMAGTKRRQPASAGGPFGPGPT